MKIILTLLTTLLTMLALTGSAIACTESSTAWLPLAPGESFSDAADQFHGPFTEVKAGVDGDNIDKFPVTDGVFAWGSGPWVARIVLYDDHYKVKNAGLTTSFWAKAYYCLK